MLGHEVKHMLVRRVAQKRSQLPARPQFPGMEGHIVERCDPLTDFPAPVGVQVVYQPVKAGSVAEGASHLADVPGEVRTGPRRTEIPHHFAGGHTNELINVRVPWRMYSNSLFSGWPGCAGCVGCLRWRIGMPVFSSQQITNLPC